VATQTTKFISAVGVLCVVFAGVFAGGYYAGRHSPSGASRDAEQRARFTQELIQIRANLMRGNLTLNDLYQLTTQYRVASDTYLASTKDTPSSTGGRACISEASDLMDAVGPYWEAVESCQSSSKCSSSLRTTLSDKWIGALADARQRLTECLGFFMQ
jgi:hypothetical protein